MTREEKCSDCYFWNNSGLVGAFNGDCCRYPERVTRNCSDFCGEFKDKKVVEILREEKKE